MEGFFFDNTTAEVIHPPFLHSCALCGLCRCCKSPKMEPTGPLRPKIYILGESPGEMDDAQGTQFVGVTGQLLRHELSELGVDVSACRFNNALNCRKVGTPTSQEIKFCRERIETDLCGARPQVVIALGNSALECLGYDYPISLMHGRCVSDQRGFWIVPVYHPSFVSRSKDKPEISSIFRKDLALAKSLVGTSPVVWDDWEQNNHLLTDVGEIHKALDGIRNAPMCTFDYETQGLRPYAEGAELLTCAYSEDGDSAFAFPISERYLSPNERREVVDHHLDLLANSSAIKVAHNLQFEMEWTMSFLKGAINGDYHCTMLLAYAMDSRPDGTSLDFLSHVWLGVRKDASLDRHKSNMSAVPLERILAYNCSDVRRQLRLFKKLWATFVATAPQIRDVYFEILRPAILSVTRAQMCGVAADKAHLLGLGKRLADEIAAAKAELVNLPALKEFHASSGKAPVFTDDELRRYLYEFKGYAPPRKTKGGTKGAVDQDSLEKLASTGDEVLGVYIDIKKKEKVRSTYTEGLASLIQPDGRFHTNYNLHITATGRLSSDSPNLQNIPNRTELGLEVRKGFVCPPGWVLLSADYSGIEAMMLAMESNDKRFKEVVVEGYDIHSEKSAALFGREFAKSRRQDAKNGFVFPTFYGAGPASIAAALGLDVDFVGYQQEELWKEFPGIRARMFRVQEFYQRNLYAESLSGRRRPAPLDYTQVLNSGPQGAASDITLHGMNRLTARGHFIPLMIHDDLTSYVRIRDFWRCVEEVKRVLENPGWSWVTLPLKVKFKVGLKNWGEMYSLDSPEVKVAL